MIDLYLHPALAGGEAPCCCGRKAIMGSWGCPVAGQPCWGLPGLATGDWEYGGGALEAELSIMVSVVITELVVVADATILGGLRQSSKIMKNFFVSIQYHKIPTMIRKTIQKNIRQAIIPPKTAASLLKPVNIQ